MTNPEVIEREQGLHKGLTTAQMTMIGLGGAIGTGLFMGSGIAIGYAGPAVLLSYVVAAFIATVIVFSLSEMAVVHPAAGSFGGLPCGLAARDTLRTEMGYPLHGQDLSTTITPVQAGSGWAVGWGKPEFWGRAALVAEKEAGPARRLRGLRATGRGVPRAGMAVLGTDGTAVGVTTSGTFSPTLKAGIALALIDSTAGVTEGSELSVDVRGRPQAVEVVKPPFVPSHVR